METVQKEPGFAAWDNEAHQIVYDGNATLLTINPVVAFADLLRTWSPDSGRPIPSIHFGDEQDDSALDEDTRGREVTTRRFELTLEISVAEYFLQKYKHKIQFPDMGMVEVRTPKDRQTTWLPVEVLDILKKQEAKALPESAASIMIKKLCTPAPERESRVMKLAQMARFGGDAWSGSFRLALTPSMHTLKSRILPPPAVAFKRGTAPIKDAVWNIMPLLEPKPIPDHSVIIFAFARLHPNVGKVASDMWDSLRQQATKLGMDIKPNIYLFNQNLSYDYDTIVKQICGAVPRPGTRRRRSP